MKNKITIICIVLLIFINIFLIVKQKKKEELNNKENIGVTVVPTMDDEILSDTSYCPTFQLVWNDMKNEIVRDDVKFEEDNTFVTNLNKESFNMYDINSDYYYKIYGPKTIELKKEIKKSIKEKFNQDSDILEDFDWSTTNESDVKRYFFYAMLYREFEYNAKFSLLGNNKFAGYDNIKYFGTNSKSNGKVREQIEVLFYNSVDSFAVKLNTKSDDEVIFYKNPIGNTFNEIYNNMIKEKDNYNGDKTFSDTDSFMAPIIDFNVKKEYTELEGKIFKDYQDNDCVIEKALQTIKFSLNEKGGKIKSEAGMDNKVMSSEKEPREFYVNDTFALFLKEKDKDKPYFAVKISDITKFN